MLALTPFPIRGTVRATLVPANWRVKRETGEMPVLPPQL